MLAGGARDNSIEARRRWRWKGAASFEAAPSARSPKRSVWGAHSGGRVLRGGRVLSGCRVLSGGRVVW